MMYHIISVQTKSDCNIVAQLAKEIWTQHYTPIIGNEQVSYMLEKFQSVSAIEAQIEAGMHYYLISHQETFKAYFSFTTRLDFLFLSKLYVLQSARGNGLGRAALSFMETKAKALELPKIRLTVNKYNTRSINAYQKMGFENVDAIVQDIGNGYVMDDYVLEKVVQ